MAFCNNGAGCGHGCGRQDDHGGDCDCYESDCRSSSRYVQSPPLKPPVTFYAVRCDGKYYHTYTRATDSGWRDKLEDSKVWTRKGPAQAMVTRLSDQVVHKGSGPAPKVELVEFVVAEVRVIDQTTRVAASKMKKEREEAERLARCKRQELERAEADLARAEARVKKLRDGDV